MHSPEEILNAEGITLFWFRRDLRLEDNHALLEALESPWPVVPIFIFDKNILDKLDNKTDARVSFIHQELERLNSEVSTIQSSVLTFYGNPEEIHSQIANKWPVKAVFANRDYEPYAQERDRKIHELYQSKGIEFKGFKDHVIFEKSEVVKGDGKPYTVFTPYMRKWKARLLEDPIDFHPSEARLDYLFKMETKPIVRLQEMGFSPTETAFPKREVNKKILMDYANTRDIPSIKGTSRLSLHLRFGTISIRHCALEGERTSEKWLNELVWRDFYQMIIYHFPLSVDSSFKPAYDRIEWETNTDHFKAWCKGKTGYPLVDAGMRELNATGFMHNRVRMVTASFLTKHLLIDWRLGERYFAEKLLDFELASNVGGWQWAASSGCDAAPYFRVFNPSLQLDKFDKDRRYVKKWVPEYGTHLYPEPIVDHKMARERVLKRFESALKN